MRKILLALLVLISVKVSAQNPVSVVKNVENDIWSVFQTRRSVRSYKADSVPEADIMKIIDAARMAPTSGNQQPWKFIIIKDKNIITQLKEEAINEAIERFKSRPENKETLEEYTERINIVFSNYLSAPVYIVILTDNSSKYPDYNHWDGPLAAENLMLAARALGYGTVFITDAISENVTKKVLNIPDSFTRICITPLGVPVEWPATPVKKDLNGFIIREKF